MVVLNKIYTRAGDDGTSGLVGGERRSKADKCFAAIGTVDEANAAIGLARLHAAGSELDGILGRIQNDLFDLGADLATVAEPAGPRGALRIVETQITRLEQEIDRLNADLSPLRSFVLPGGSPAAAALHFSRTVCRRAEREMVALQAADEPVSSLALGYINRLSDLLFVAARSANDEGRTDVLWAPGANR